MINEEIKNIYKPANDRIFHRFGWTYKAITQENNLLIHRYLYMVHRSKTKSEMTIEGGNIYIKHDLKILVFVKYKRAYVNLSVLSY